MIDVLEAAGNIGLSMSLRRSPMAFTATLAFHNINLAFLVDISRGIALRILRVVRRLASAPLDHFFLLMVTGFSISMVTPSMNRRLPEVYVARAGFLAELRPTRIF